MVIVFILSAEFLINKRKIFLKSIFDLVDLSKVYSSHFISVSKVVFYIQLFYSTFSGQYYLPPGPKQHREAHRLQREQDRV